MKKMLVLIFSLSLFSFAKNNLDEKVNNIVYEFDVIEDILDDTNNYNLKKELKKIEARYEMFLDEKKLDDDPKNVNVKLSNDEINQLEAFLFELIDLANKYNIKIFNESKEFVDNVDNRVNALVLEFDNIEDMLEDDFKLKKDLDILEDRYEYFLKLNRIKDKPINKGLKISKEVLEELESFVEEIKKLKEKR